LGTDRSGPRSSGPINGLQASFARVSFATANLIPLPDGENGQLS
jgi:hypothetical protein